MKKCNKKNILIIFTKKQIMKKKELSTKLIKKLYEEDFKLITENGKETDIPEGGSLGLLALGYKGLIAWRKKKRNIKNRSEKR